MGGGGCTSNPLEVPTSESRLMYTAGQFSSDLIITIFIRENVKNTFATELIKFLDNAAS